MELTISFGKVCLQKNNLNNKLKIFINNNSNLKK